MGAKIEQHRDLYKQSGGSLDLYSDFLHSFRPHPNTGQISRKTNVEAVKLAIRNLLLTSPGERVMQPEFGSSLKQQVFENISNISVDGIETSIRDAIGRQLPYVIINEIAIDAKPDDNMINISIEFSVTLNPDVFDTLTFNFNIGDN